MRAAAVFCSVFFVSLTGFAGLPFWFAPVMRVRECVRVSTINDVESCSRTDVLEIFVGGGFSGNRSVVYPKMVFAARFLFLFPRGGERLRLRQQHGFMFGRNHYVEARKELRFEL